MQYVASSLVVDFDAEIKVRNILQALLSSGFPRVEEGTGKQGLARRQELGDGDKFWAAGCLLPFVLDGLR